MNEELKKKVLLTWHEFTNSEMLTLNKAQEFVNMFNPEIDVKADFNNEKTPFHIDPLNNKRETILYKDEIFQMIGVV